MGLGVRADVALFAEAGRAVGTGHLIEVLTIANELVARSIRPVLVVPSEAPAELVSRAAVPVEVLATLGPLDLAEVAKRLVACGVRMALTNFRKVSDEQVSVLAKAGIPVICIDEFGGRHLNCTMVINPSPVSARHQVTSDIPGFRVYGGLRYLALSVEYVRWHSAPRQFAGGIRSLVVSMGGVDRTGATLRVVEALRDWDSDAERHIVLGADFQWGDDLDRLLGRSPTNWWIHRNLPSLADLLASADVGISAGGNTLCEMACVGAPALVLYEDDHEAEQGRAFEAQGFGLCLGAETEVSTNSIRRALDRFEDPSVRQAHSESGRCLVDGRGASRICQIIAEQLSVDSPVATRS